MHYLNYAIGTEMRHLIDASSLLVLAVRDLLHAGVGLTLTICLVKAMREWREWRTK